MDWEIPAHTVHEFASKRTKYCICIPILNESERFKTQLAAMTAITSQADIIIADGGSTDGSTAYDFLTKNGVRTILVKTGPGKLGAQLRMGYAYALQQGYKGIITIDGNNKDDPAAIPIFLAALDSGYDLLQGSRFISGGQAINTPLLRLLAIRLLHSPLLSFAAHFWYTDTTNGFRGYSRRFLLDPRVQPFRNIFNTYELLAYLTVRAPRLHYKVKELPVTRRYPPRGKVPTKIHSISGYVALLTIVIRAMLGRFNPC